MLDEEAEVNPLTPSSNARSSVFWRNPGYCILKTILGDESGPQSWVDLVNYRYESGHQGCFDLVKKSRQEKISNNYSFNLS
jgi:hypothetical protein